MARLLAAVLATLLTACAANPGGAAQPELVVFAASSLTAPLEEIGPAFGAAHGVRVTPSFGATSALRAQLEQGARADVFAAANREQMALADARGLVVGEPTVVALNRLVVIARRDGPGAVRRLEELADPGRRIVITPPDVPIGAYTREVLARMAADPRFGADFEERVLANVRSEEPNVKQLVAKVELGEADAAWVYATDATDAVAVLPVPEPFNLVVEYPAAVGREARQPALARAFIAYLLSEPAQAVLVRHGFSGPR